MTPIKLLVSASGTLARPVNPNIGKGSSPSLWVLFDLANPERPLTERCEPGSEIMGDVEEQLYSPTVGWVDKKSVTDITKHIRESRKAYRPIKENHLSDSEKEIGETVEQAAKLKLNWHYFDDSNNPWGNGFIAGSKFGAQWQQSQSNRQLVDIIELLEKSKYPQPGNAHQKSYNEALTDILTNLKTNSKIIPSCRA